MTFLDWLENIPQLAMLCLDDAISTEEARKVIQAAWEAGYDAGVVDEKARVYHEEFTGDTLPKKNK